jgi:chromosome segregation ATPase
MSKSIPIHERYLWRAGKPVFDIFTGLFGGSATVEAEFEKVLLKSGIDDLIERRATLEHQISSLREKMSGWVFERENLATRLAETRGMLLDALIDGDPADVNDEKQRLSLEIERIDEWIQTAEQIVFENQRAIKKLLKEIERAYHEPVMAVRDQAQAKIDALVEQIVRVEQDYQAAVRQIISDVKPSFPGSIAWVELRARLPASLRCGV